MFIKMKRNDAKDAMFYEEEIDNLKFETEQLHQYTDYLQQKLTNIEHFLRQGITFHKLLVEENPTMQNRKHLSFIEDALSIVKTPMNMEKEKEKKGNLKSIYDLK